MQSFLFSKPETNSVFVETHKFIKYLFSKEQFCLTLKNAALKYHAILLLPPQSIMNEIPITYSFLASHLILLNESHRFISFTYIPGVIQGSLINIYPQIPPNKSYNLLTQTISIESFDNYGCDGEYIRVIRIYDIIRYQGCEWAWKKITFYEHTQYHIALFIQQLLESSGKSTQNGILGTQQEIRNQLNEEVVIFKIIQQNRISTQELERFVLNFPTMIKGTSLEERKSILDTFCSNSTRTFRKHTSFNVMNAKCLKSVLQRLLTIRLFPYIWQPSVAILEGLTFKSVAMDCDVYSMVKVHNFITLEHLGLSNKNIPFIGEIITLLKDIDSVRSPNDKLEYLIGVYNMTKSLCEEVFSEGDTITLLKYVVIKSQPPNLASTINFVKLFADLKNSEQLLNIYGESFHMKKEIQKVARSQEIEITEVPSPLTDKKLLSFLSFSSNESPDQIESLLKKSAENITDEEIPLLIRMLKQLHEDNTQLKKIVSPKDK
ncbi:VPS9 domain-containing protein [Entamoeba marina]